MLVRWAFRVTAPDSLVVPHGTTRSLRRGRTTGRHSNAAKSVCRPMEPPHRTNRSGTLRIYACGVWSRCVHGGCKLRHRNRKPHPQRGRQAEQGGVVHKRYAVASQNQGPKRVDENRGGSAEIPPYSFRSEVSNVATPVLLSLWLDSVYVSTEQIDRW